MRGLLAIGEGLSGSAEVGSCVAGVLVRGCFAGDGASSPEGTSALRLMTIFFPPLPDEDLGAVVRGAGGESTLESLLERVPVIVNKLM